MLFAGIQPARTFGRYIQWLCTGICDSQNVDPFTRLLDILIGNNGILFQEGVKIFGILSFKSNVTDPHRLHIWL